MKTKVSIEGMSCGHCAARVREALESVPGVSKAKVDHKKGSAVVTLNEEVALDVLKDAVNETGYTLTGR